MKKFSSVFSCFHTDMNKYIFPVQQKISGNFPENFLEIFRNIFFRKSYITIPDAMDSLNFSLPYGSVWQCLPHSTQLKDFKIAIVNSCALISNYPVIRCGYHILETKAQLMLETQQCD